MIGFRDWITPTSAVAAIVVAAVALVLLFDPAGTGAATGLCPAVSGSSHPGINGPLTISAPGVYNGDGRTITGGEHNIVIQANNVTVCNYVLKNALDSGVYIGNGTFSGVRLGSLTIQGFNQRGSGGSQPDGPQYIAGVACWYCNSLTVVDSTISTTHAYGNGIWIKRLTASSAGADYLAGNTITGGWDGIGSEPEDDPNGGFGNDTVIENNVIRDCNDDGIQVEGRDQNVTVRNNEISGCGVGVASAPVLVGPLRISNNYIHDLRYAPSTAFFCYKMGDSQSSGTPEIDYTGNVCKTGAGTDPGGLGAGGFTQTNEGLKYKIMATNNCTQTGMYVIEFNDTPGAGTLFDNNTYYTTDSQRFAKWGSDRITLSGLHALGQDMHSTIHQCTTPPLPGPSGAPTPTRTPTTPTPTPSQLTSSTSTTPTMTQAGATATPVEPPPRIVADMTCDGYVTLQDAMRVLQIISGHREFGGCSLVVDVNCDGKVTTVEALTILLTALESATSKVPGCQVSVWELVVS